MSRVYISSWSKPLALAAKDALEDAGHTVISTWHQGEFKRTAERTTNEMENGALDNCELIVDADILFLFVPPDLSPGGIYVEAGVAIGLGIPVVAVGVRENCTRGNNMLYHPDVHQFVRVDDAVANVQEIDDDNWAAEEEEYEDDDDDDGVSVFDTSDILVSPDTVLGCGCKVGEPCGFGDELRPGIDCPDGSETGLQDD